MSKNPLTLFFVVLVSLGLLGCENVRDTPPIDLFEEMGHSVEIASTSLYIDQAHEMLNSFCIKNDYPSTGKDIVVVYLIRSEEDGRYYEMFYPVDRDHEMIVRETSIPEFAIIQSELDEYVALNSGVSIDVFEGYSGMFFFPNAFDGNFDSNIDALGELGSPIILEVGKIEMESSCPSICLARDKDGRFVLFYYDIQHDEIAIISEVA